MSQWILSSAVKSTTQVSRECQRTGKSVRPARAPRSGPDVAKRDADGRTKITSSQIANRITQTVSQGSVPRIPPFALIISLITHLNVSVRKIENDFSSIYRHTLRDEIAAQRLDLLCTALRTSNEPIKTLVARAGFGDMSQATRTFKARFGMTMSEYRSSSK